MRIIHLAIALTLLMGATLLHAAGSTQVVRAIAFVASHDRGQSDPRLAPYEPVLRANLRFESFRYVGESSATVASGEKAAITAPGGGRIVLHGDGSGEIEVRRGGTTVTISRGRPAVFMGGPAGRGGVSGVIVLAE